MLLISFMLFLTDNKKENPPEDTQPHAPPSKWPAPVYAPRCDVTGKDISSAIRRAKTLACRQEIADVFCTQQEGKLYKLDLPRFCPNKGREICSDHDCWGEGGSFLSYLLFNTEWLLTTSIFDVLRSTYQQVLEKPNLCPLHSFSWLHWCPLNRLVLLAVSVVRNN